MTARLSAAAVSVLREMMERQAISPIIGGWTLNQRTITEQMRELIVAGYVTAYSFMGMPTHAKINSEGRAALAAIDAAKEQG